MSIELLIFDLDGVLCDSRQLHYESLNMALSTIDNRYCIPYLEHLSTYDGLPTTEKLKLLTKHKNLPIELYNKIWQLKQEMTVQAIDNIVVYDKKLNDILSFLKSKNYKLVCASNSIWSTMKMMLLKLGILKHLDYFISNEEVKYPKPHPEIYFEVMKRFGRSPNQTLIFEDSHIGRTSAFSSGAHVCPIIDPDDLTIDKILNYIEMSRQSNMNIKLDLRWKRKINVVIPMAGMGSRFQNAGYTQPKPFITIGDKMMIEHVIDNLNIDGQFVYIMQKQHITDEIVNKLNILTPNCHIVSVDQVTQGAACTILLTHNLIDNDTPLLIANSDQYVEWDSNEFLYIASHPNLDGAILTFKSDDSKWSYASLSQDGFVKEVREKEVISDHATVGIYYWSSGSQFVKYAKSMIDKNIRVKGEFYVSPVYNEAISEGLKIKIHDCKKMWGIGDPRDLDTFKKLYLKQT